MKIFFWKTNIFPENQAAQNPSSPHSAKTFSPIRLTFCHGILTYILLNFSRIFCRKLHRELHRTATFCAVKRANKNVRVVKQNITTRTLNIAKSLTLNILQFTRVRVVLKNITTRTPNIAKPLTLNTLHFTRVRVVTKSITTRTPYTAKPL
ncbi:MAG: hypothetical protein K2H10_06625, partial [Bacteroidales bacterium]|nr:hypothetical protein [Bacteroidales bacterium]